MSAAIEMREALAFIRSRPAGVTRKDLDKQGINVRRVERLVKLRAVKATQVRDRARGPRAYHWLWKYNDAMMLSGGPG